MSANPSRRWIIVGPAVSELRRELGPTCWVVLEEMLAHSDGDAACCSAEVSVRRLGMTLDLAKDTVARAIRRLRAAGIVTALPARAPAGTFDAGSYSVNVPPAVSFDCTHTTEPVDAETHTTVTHVPDVSRRGRVARLEHSQLSFANWD